MALDNLLVSLKELQTLVNNYYCALYDCQMIKEKVNKLYFYLCYMYVSNVLYFNYFQIDYYLHVLCQPFSSVFANSSSELNLSSGISRSQGNPWNFQNTFLGEKQQSSLQELKSSISILFLYQRKIISDKVFINETRQLLLKIIAVLLQVTSWKDHFFVMNHILR